MVRVLVCGGRDYADAAKVNNALDRLHATRGIEVVMHGAAKGADALADEWARRNRVSLHTFPAQWEKHGKAAGPIRNQRMLAVGRPDLVIAFPGGTGTADMVHIALVSSVEVIKVCD